MSIEPPKPKAKQGRAQFQPVRRIVARWGHDVLDRIDAGLEQGALEAHLPDGSIRILGGRAPGPSCIVDLRRWRALAKLGLGGSVGWYEAWEAGDWSSPDPVPLFALFMANGETLGRAARAKGAMLLMQRLYHWRRRNHRAGSRRNILAHYDLGNDFYALWLDQGMNYSSAIFADEKTPLADAQHAKNDAILDRLNLNDGQTLLEIGCGWGALAARALDRAGVRYTGLTLSPSQKGWADDRLAGRDATVLLTDYRDMDGQFDAIASVEMVEAVGQDYWPTYLAAIHSLLKPGGRAAIQYIAIKDSLFDRYAQGADFIQRYIFPGGMLLSESRFRALTLAQGLTWSDCQHFGQDYARTLRLWRERFDMAVEAGKLPVSFDARFVRLWRYYLMYCEGGFVGGGISVAQVTLSKP